MDPTNNTRVRRGVRKLTLEGAILLIAAGALVIGCVMLATGGNANAPEGSWLPTMLAWLTAAL